jgi:hypothetical protein
MTGLISLAIVGLWVWLAFKLSRFISGRVAQGRWAKPLTALLFLVLLPMPVIDEIIGGFQFRALCDKNAKLVFNVDPASLKGKTVHAFADPLDKQVGGTLVRITYTRSIYRDTEGGKELMSFTAYRAKGGWLIRALSFDDNMMPLTFKSSCNPLTSVSIGFKSVQHAE